VPATQLLSALVVALTLTATPANQTSSLDETARFLAGKGVAADSPLAAWAQGRAYTDYSSQVTSSWARFAQPNLAELQHWSKQQLGASAPLVFYPFSGPDIANALALFPDADTYVLFGLEPIGALPTPRTMSPEALTAGLSSVHLSLDTIFEANFFVTRGMQRKVGQTALNGIAGLLMLFLSLSDCTITGARRIAIGPDATLQAGTADDEPLTWQNPVHSRVPGVELTFTRAGGKPQTVRYFMLNVDDAALTKSAPNFLPWVKRLGPLATMLKSASYLLHQDSAREPAPSFDQLRTLLLAQSQVLVQDDSGVPLKYFSRERWKLAFHGAYEAPIPMFSNRLQKDLKLELSLNSTGRLPFSYGYNRKRGEANLMTAVRIQERSR
jgi:hypothetical protein